MISPKLRNKNFMQLCWVVPDLFEAIDSWVDTSGAGPFFVFDNVHFECSFYRGRAMDIAPHRAAIGQFGDMQIELVEPTTDQPGIWTDVVAKGARGFHHAGLYCENYAAEREAYLASGAEVAFEGLMMGAKTCYIDTMKEIGFMTELITANPVAASVFAAFRNAAEGWDGRDRVRTLG